ncbi:MAG: hypothetical protein QM669_04510 [Siphonobacter sp.]
MCRSLTGRHAVFMNITTSTYGSYQSYILQNPTTGDEVHILPELGGIIRQLTLTKDGQPLTVIDTPENPEEFGNNPDYASAFLFPWPSRLNNGRYEYKGKAYQLPINEPATKGAIHGIVHHAVFKVVETWADGAVAGILLRYDQDGSYPGYPFPFRFEIRYELLSSGKLAIMPKAINTGAEIMPVALGWHPYFQLPGGTVDDWTIYFPAEEQILLDAEFMMPVGTVPFEAQEGYKLKNRTLDAIYKLDDSGYLTRLVSPIQNVTLNLEYTRGEGKVNYQVVFTFPDRKRVAMEPLTANVNAFNNGEGLYELQPEEIYQMSYQLYLS